MTTILLVRHGETDYVKKHRLAGRKPGIPLNERGQEQAEGLAKMLGKAPVKAVYSSPIKRARQTAAPIAKALNHDVNIREGLLETEIGKWEDMPLKKVSKKKSWRVVQQNPSVFRFPGGEAFAETQIRISNELLTLAAKHDPKDLIVCVSHSDPIKLAIAYFLGLPLDNFQRLVISTASISILHVGEAGAHLAAMNLNAEITLNLLKS